MKYYSKARWGFLFLVFGISIHASKAQSSDTASYTLNQCISFALQNQSQVHAADIDAEINSRNVKAQLAAWFPQVQVDFLAQHALKLPTAFFPNFNDPNGPRLPIQTGIKNTSNALFELNQTIFSSDVLMASKAGKYVNKQSKEAIENTKINTVMGVTNAFYDVLLTEKHVQILEEDMARQQKLLKDSYALYEAGINDKIDYQRTTIAINNTLSERKRTQEVLTSKKRFLKQQMGFPMEDNLKVTIDSAQSIENLYADTLQKPDISNRVEYQLLETQKELQILNVKYNKWGFLPSVSAFINYNFAYMNQDINKMYSKNYPNSALGLRASMPIFQGTRRYQNLQIAKLEVQRTELSMQWYKDQYETEYSRALAVYKSALYDLKIQTQNREVAREVYQLIKLQYDQGIRTYLDVSDSENDLRNADFNYANALYGAYMGKLDLERTLGTVNTNY
jgi:outer membrane protein